MKPLKTALILPLFASSLMGATYYVSPAGSDSTGTGGILNPWQTLKHALGQASCGDTVTMRDGVYNEYLGAGDVPSCTSTTILTIQAGVAANPIIKAPNGNTSTLWLNYVDYTVWRDITFDNANLTEDGVHCHDVVVLTHSSHNRFERIEARNSLCNTIQIALSSNYNVITKSSRGESNLHHGGTSYPQGNPLYNLRDDHGVYINQNSHDNVVEFTYVHDILGFGLHAYNSGYGGLDGTIFRYNVIEGVGHRDAVTNAVMNSAGILLSDGTSQLAYGNIIIGSLGAGINAGNGPTTGIYNNTIVGNDSGATGWGAITLSYGYGVIQNNILYGNNAISIYEDAANAASNYTCSNNLNMTNCGLTEGTTNPVFVNSGSGDYHLQSTSPARALGADLSAIFTTDLDGATIVNWDSGALQY